MKDFLLKLKKAKEQEIANTRKSIKDSQDVNEVRSLGEVLDKLVAELNELDAKLAEADAPAAEENSNEDEGRSAFNPMGQYAMNTRADKSNIEARKAFQHYMATGEKRATTKTSDANISTIIPENLVDQILEKFEQLGVIYNLVNKTSFPVGQSIPVDGVKPTATWVGRNTSTLASSTSGEGVGSTAQGKTLGALISFNHYKLRCEISLTEEVATMTLAAFEALFVKQVGEAMLRAQEFAIVEGDGYGMPTGILHETPVSGQAITIAEGSAINYAKLCEMEAAVPAQYEASAKWCMTKQTFMNIVGMVDSTGQPIARVNYGINGKPERYILGREVVIYIPQVGSKLKSYAASVDADTLIAFIFNFDDYTLNTNYDLGIQHKVDWDNEDHKTKAVLGEDGKVVVKDSLVTLTIDAA